VGADEEEQGVGRSRTRVRGGKRRVRSRRAKGAADREGEEAAVDRRKRKEGA